MSLVSVIIVNWNSKDYVRQCLASLYARCSSHPLEVIVVDGASYDGCGEMLAAEFPDARFVQSPENIGFGRSNNLGAQHAGGDYLLLLNPDTLLLDDAIATFRVALDTLPSAGAVGCRLLNTDRSLQTSCVQAFPTPLNQALDSEFLRRRFPNSALWGIKALHADSSAPQAVEVISGACIFLRREVFNRVGGFTEQYFMYGEDLDLSFKIRQAGLTVYYVPAISIVHFGGGSSKQAASDFSTIMMHDSVSRFIRTHRGSASALLHRFLMALSAIIRLVLMVPLMLFGDRIVRHGKSSWRKWFAILRWTVGLEANRPPTAIRPKSNVLRETKIIQS